MEDVSPENFYLVLDQECPRRIGHEKDEVENNSSSNLTYSDGSQQVDSSIAIIDTGYGRRNFRVNQYNSFFPI
jgi:hypothetical protein